MKKFSKGTVVKFVVVGCVLAAVSVAVCNPFSKLNSEAATPEEDDFDYEAFYEELNWSDEEEEESETEYPKVIVDEREYGIKIVYKHYEHKIEKIAYDKDGNVIFRDVFEF